MAAVAMPPPPVSAMRDEHVMDTRTPSPVQRTNSEESAAEQYKPDLSAEVAMLSTKLVNAINYQTNLDDSLQQTRHELDQARKDVARLQAQKKEVDDMITNGVFLRKVHVDKTINQLRAELAAERAKREAAEKAKKETEGELENLTSALFEEANTMVAAARRDTEAAEKRNSQLRSQLQDNEVLLASQQEQLQDLKGVMERMERASEHDGSMPSTPINPTTAVWDSMQLSPHAATGPTADLTPEHPLHFSHLIVPIVRNDITAYTDFADLLTLARRASPHSRTGSNSTNNHTASSSQPNLSMINTSSPSLPGAFSFSANNSPQSATFQQPPPPLKESKFYKRTLIEDIEPTLRLDLAPGLSFLTRRSVLSSLLSGSLVVEPTPHQPKHYSPGCALCGESRRSETYIRRHRFRTSEEETAQRYPLCDYCLSRIRATGDFVGFLRMVRDGHWRAESEEEVKGAWDESVRLRERMFWARIGGGVVPAALVMDSRRAGLEQVEASPGSVRGVKSARQSLESIPEGRRDRSSTVIGDEEGRGLALRPKGDEEEVGTSGTMLEPTESVEDEGPTTPYEDAQTNSQDEQAGADEQLRREEDSSAPSDRKDEQAAADEQLQREASGILGPSVDRVKSSDTVPTIKEPISTGSVSDEKSASPAPPPNERRPSAVLARVRAMEAKAQGSGERKLPGAFD